MPFIKIAQNGSAPLNNMAARAKNIRKQEASSKTKISEGE